MADGVVVGPSPLGARVIGIKYERSGSVVHRDCAPLVNITFPIAVPSPWTLQGRQLWNKTIHNTSKAAAKPAVEHVQLFRMRYKRGTGL